MAPSFPSLLPRAARFSDKPRYDPEMNAFALVQTYRHRNGKRADPLYPARPPRHPTPRQTG